MPKPEKKLKNFHCRKCKTLLGRTDGVTLRFRINDYDTEISIKNFPFPCKCGQITVWRGEFPKRS